jgi:choline dehydrogenase-like flavoprotein
MAYTRAQDSQVDAWEALGNSGRNWDSLLPYYEKSEKFKTPADWHTVLGVTYDASVHGFSGPLKTGYPNSIINSSIIDTMNETYSGLGLLWNDDVNSGHMRGFTSHPRTIDQAENVREDAARAYYWPYINRTNLILFSNTLANKIVWKQTCNETCGCDEAVAGGIEVTTANGTITTIYARKEVILSAGAVRSSSILELSGVGNPDILSPLGIEVVVDLPTVGENLQDQTNNGLVFADNKNYTGTTSFVGYLTAADLFGANVSSFAESIAAKIPSYAAAVATASNNVVSEADLLNFFNTQYSLSFNSSVPIVEIFNTVTGSIIDMEYWILLPFSRGNIHITSTTPGQTPDINPNYFMLDSDLDVQTASAKFIRNQIFKTEPLLSIITWETSPGFDVLAEDSDAEAYGNWIKDTYRTNYHPVGTTAMMSKNIGGVVSDRLVVYGTKNVRVVDAGILPFQVCGHLVSTLYAVAEKAADLIKEDM